jgi:predicted  nucleic acid-binding Zn-ribbon protein
MKYYCENCGSEFDSAHTAIYSSMRCQCGKKAFKRIPDFETPEQCEARTGKSLPDKTHTFLFSRSSNTYKQVYYKYAKMIQKRHGAYLYPFIVYANVPRLPSDNWRPE